MSVQLSACQTESPTVPYVSDVKVFAPFPGGSAAVAYFKVINPGTVDLEIRAITSPEFAQIEMHETNLVDGVARMRSLDKMVVAANTTLELQAGGKHLMLLGPKGGTSVGSAVALSLAFSDGSTIIAESSMLSRAVQ